MKAHILLSVCLVTVILSCSTAKKPTGVWVNKEKMQGKSFSKVFIVAQTANIEARMMVENDLATAAIEKGYTTIKSYEHIPFSLDDPKPPTKDQVVSKVNETGCDAVLVATVLKKEEAVRYVKGKTAYGIQPYYSYYGSYYSHYYETVNKKGYYAQDKEYFVQTNLYDTKSEEIMWSVQSTIFNPGSLASFSRYYTTTLGKQLASARIAKQYERR